MADRVRISGDLVFDRAQHADRVVAELEEGLRAALLGLTRQAGGRGLTDFSLRLTPQATGTRVELEAGCVEGAARVVDGQLWRIARRAGLAAHRSG